MVDSVRVHRAMQDLSTRVPKIGSLSMMRSITICIFSLRFQASRKKYTPPPMPPKIRYQYLMKNSLMAITTSVGMGSSPPNDEKTSLNEGITKIMMTATTTKATISTVIGYIKADLIFDLIASVFSMYTASRSSNWSRMPADSPASTRLQ